MLAISLALVVAQTTGPGALVDAFLSSLDREKRAKATFAFDAEERFNWGFVPRERKGTSREDLDTAQRGRLDDLLLSILGPDGFKKAAQIRLLESVLRDLEGPHRNPEAYFASVFGTPGKGRWGVRYEGHHLSLNYTYDGDKLVSTTPQFLGANPAEVRSGPHKGLRVLAKEEDLARELAKSLTGDQRTAAISSAPAPADIVTSNSRKTAILKETGVRYESLDARQRAILRALIEAHASVQRRDVVAARLGEADWHTMEFAWIGGLDRGQGHYYRVQCSKFLIEYDNTQNEANHVHAVWRDFKGDFGEDVLAEHYATSPHHHRH